MNCERRKQESQLFGSMAERVKVLFLWRLCDPNHMI